MDSAKYSVRWFAEEAGPCQACTGKTGRGVLGAVEIEGGEPAPLCDNCCMELAPDLAIVVVAVQVLREVGEMARVRVTSDTVAAFLAFAKSTDRACGWPRRIHFLRDIFEVSVEDVLEDGAN